MQNVIKLNVVILNAMAPHRFVSMARAYLSTIPAVDPTSKQ